MGYFRKKTILIAMDILIVCMSIYFSYFFRMNGHISAQFFRQLLFFSITTTMICIGIMYCMKLYNRIWQYASVPETLAILKAVVLSCAASYLLTFLFFGEGVPISIMIQSLETMALLIGGARFIWKYRYYNDAKKKKNTQKALIIGAGDCGSLIVKELQSNLSSNLNPIGFIDDDLTKHKHQIHGIPVIGARNEIVETVAKLKVDYIIIAMPSASRSDITDIIEICKSTNAKLKIFPTLSDVIKGKIAIQQIRDVQVEDLLGREAVNVDLEGIANYVQQKTVLVTGAGGSIGSELCRQIAPFLPTKLVLLGHGENSIYTIEMELRNKFPALSLETIIADIQDRSRIEEVFREFRPHVVFHAAAHKHVPLMERNPAEAIKNNVFGTRNVAECADQYNAERFVLISTDKAVNPTSVMGTTKRIAEMIIQSLNNRSNTVFAAVRFGNVLGSRGSVIPRFKEQIKNGGPVTVTHPEMIRYFMTIPEAVQLVIQAGSLASGGEVFVLDMGEPVKIVDLARDLIRLSGFEPGIDIKINYSGIRPGEKLYEELLTNEEGLASTKHDRIYIGKPLEIEMSTLLADINTLARLLNQEKTEIYRYLEYIVPTFKSPQNAEQTKIIEPDKKQELALAGM